MSEMYPFIFRNLQPLTALGQDTTLCVYPPRKRLYVVKAITPDQIPIFRRLLSVNDPHLAAPVYVETGSSTAQVMYEYVSGCTLGEYLNEKGILSKQEAVAIADQVCLGLSCLHRLGLVHRDVNPNNIIISSDGIVKIIDLGIIRSYSQPRSADTAILGTPGYAAPEQFGFTQSDARTDIYAVGVLLNVMCTGQLPGSRLADGQLGRVVRQCTDIDANKRYRSVEELRQAMRGHPGGTGGLDRVIAAIPGVRSQNPAVVILALVSYLFAFLLIIAGFSNQSRSPAALSLYLVSLVFSTVIPFCSFHNFLGIWDRLPITRSASRRSQRLFFLLIGTVSLVIGLLILSVLPQVP